MFVADFYNAVDNAAETTKGLIQISPNGSFTALGGTFSSVTGVAVDGAGNLFVIGSGHLVKLSATNRTAVTEVLVLPNNGALYGVAIDAAGTLYAAGDGNSIIYKVSPTGALTQLGTGSYQSGAVAVDGAGKARGDPLEGQHLSVPFLPNCKTGAGNLYGADSSNSLVFQLPVSV